MKPRWLITGAGGFLGSHLCRQLPRRGFDVVAQVRTHRPEAGGIETVSCDFTQKQSGRNLVRQAHPAVVVHCAAMTNVDVCEREPALAQRINADLCGEIAEGCREEGARLVMISTDQLWRAAKPWIGEDLPPDPAGVYGLTKAAGERQCATLADHLILRTNFFGRGPSWRPSLSDLILQTVREGNVFTGFDDIYYTPVEVTLAVQWFIDAINRDLRGVYHVAGRDRLSKFEFARQLAERAGYGTGLVRPVSVSAAKLAAVRPAEMSLDCDKIATALGRPVPSVEESIERCLSEVAEHAIVTH
jgi:dTDP-4-dehydrorhamnose reductase